MKRILTGSGCGSEFLLSPHFWCLLASFWLSYGGSRNAYQHYRHSISKWDSGDMHFSHFVSLLFHQTVLSAFSIWYFLLILPLSLAFCFRFASFPSCFFIIIEYFFLFFLATSTVHFFFHLFLFFCTASPPHPSPFLHNPPSLSSPPPRRRISQSCDAVAGSDAV